MSQPSFMNYLSDLDTQDAVEYVASQRMKRPLVQNRDSAASKRQRTTGEDTDSLFFSEDDDSTDDHVVRVTEPDSNGTWSHSANIRDCVNGRSNLNATTSQARTRPPTASTPTTVSASGATSRSNGVSPPSQIKSTAKATDATTPKKKAADAEIKEEPEKLNVTVWVEGVEEKDRIKIFVGRRQKQAFARREEVAKSSVLTGYIVEDAEHGPYIMRPQLLRTDPNDFDAVLQFIHTSTFEPVVTQNKDDGGCFKNITSDQDHGRELVRLGKIYVIAQMFKVDALEDAIYDKVSAVNPRRFPNKALVELASVIFNDKRVPSRSGNGAASATSSQTGQEETDKFEEWIITKIATNLQDIQKYHHEDFWAVEKKTSKKMFYARVLELAAEIYRANSGKLPGPTSTIVELD